MNIGGQTPWNAIPICETSQISYLIGRRPMKDVLGSHLKDQSVRLVHWLSITLSLRRTSQESIDLEKKVLPGLFLGYALYAEGIRKGDVLVADLEKLETMDASEIYSKRLDAKEVIFPEEKGEFIFPIADARIKNPGGDQELRTSTSIQQRPTQGASHIGFLGESEGLFHHLMTHFWMPVKQLMTSGPCQETSYTAITLNPESNFTRRGKNHSLFQ